jgi:DNA-binding transcriptional LysR family regulator
MRYATLRQLEVFESVARNSSFTQAARELHLSQPAVSAQVHQLEEYAGVALFEQLGRTVHLTQAGVTMLEHSREIIQRFRAVTESMQEAKGVAGGTLIVSAITAGDSFFPHLLAAFVREHAGVRIDLRVVNRGELLKQVSENTTDLGIMGRMPEDAELVSEPFARHPFFIIARPDHPLAGKRGIALAKLVDEPFVEREEASDTWRTMEKVLGALTLKARIRMRLGSNETVKQAVMAGLGIAFLSAHAVALELEVGRLVALDVRGFPHTENWHVVHHRGKRLPPVARAFKEFLLTDGARIIESVTHIPSRTRAPRLGKARARADGGVQSPVNRGRSYRITHR